MYQHEPPTHEPPEEQFAFELHVPEQDASVALPGFAMKFCQAVAL